MTCPHCGGLYAIAQDFLDEALKLGGFRQCWTCPYCKESRGYGEGRIQQLERELAEKARIVQNREQALLSARQRTEDALREADHFRKSRDGMKGVLMKVKTRIAKSTCPCCNRHFPNDKLASHLATKHPDFTSVSP